jgi:hypothetical protein
MWCGWDLWEVLEMGVGVYVYNVSVHACLIGVLTNDIK